MALGRRFALWALLALLWAAALGAHAENYTLWVHGRGFSGQPGNYEDFTGWGPATVNAGINKKAVNWDGRSHISTQAFRLRNALDCFCTGPNWCWVAAHSAGDLMIGYVLDLYGGTWRHKKTPVPNSDGRCTDSDGRMQRGWNIKSVSVAGGAAGGTELANNGSWTTSEPLVLDLKTATARALYNHNNTRGVWFTMYAGARGGLLSALLPGQDDDVVPYHSSGGISGSGGGSYCNPGDWFCDDLTLGPDPAQDGRPKWANHSVRLRDDGENYGHTRDGVWGGIVAPMRADLELEAR